MSDKNKSLVRLIYDEVLWASLFRALFLELLRALRWMVVRVFVNFYLPILFVFVFLGLMFMAAANTEWVWCRVFVCR